MKQAVFIERDGILNEARLEGNSPVSPLTLDALRIKRDAAEPLKRLRAAGLMLFATTNQPGLSRGYQSRRELDRIHDLLRATFALDEILVCPHDDTDHCPCRKPKPGLLTEAAFEWHLDLDHSFVLSDKWQDAEAARAVGCTSVLLQSPWLGKVHRDLVLPDLTASVEKILKLTNSRPRAVVEA
ncbi:MAG: HAD family hydrolase [Verrucomicrobia bacterium]|nr:MAG: HAD family hydrolase [Verrucomicrobiota bacterium]